MGHRRFRRRKTSQRRAHSVGLAIRDLLSSRILGRHNASISTVAQRRMENFRFRKNRSRQGRHRNPQTRRIANLNALRPPLDVRVFQHVRRTRRHRSRNCVGYAIQQIEVGTLDPSKNFVPVAKSPTEPATTYTASSIDPWHSSEDARDGGDYQHTGFDLFFTSGLTTISPP